MRKWLFFLLLLVLSTACAGTSGTGPKDASDTGEGIIDGRGADLEVVAAVCGDGTCTPGKEFCNDCPEDCGNCQCGDGVCTPDLEFCDECPEDCGECPDECGDGQCDAEEDCASCPGDCGNCCGNGECGEDEDCESCPDDCGPCACGNGECGEGEDCESCPDDCGECTCGDGFCTGDETCESCPEDCDECPGPCGNGECGDDEDCESCPEDCGECTCGDGKCTGDETCDSCPDDCTNCDPYCGDGVVDEGLEEECDDGNNAPDDGCDEECKIEPQAVEPGDIVITEIMKNPAAVDDGVGEWFELYNTTADPVDLNGWMLEDEGIDSHKIFAYGGVVIPGKGHLVIGKSTDKETNGGVDVDYVCTNFNLSNKDDEIILSVYGVIIDQVAYDNGAAFPNTVGAALSLSPESYDAGLNDAGGSWCDAPTTYGDGDFGSPGEANPDCEGGEPWCGDGLCNGDESCQTCPDDCDECPPDCGDDVCDEGETCADCPDDCGACCGNGQCDNGETCATCQQDCGSCCGNGQCDNGEDSCSCLQDCPDDPNSCSSCECIDSGGNCSCAPGCHDLGTCCANACSACGICAPECGDGQCNGNETCSSCPQDCGSCCGNGQCDNGETCATCPGDCGSCCGNGQCDNGETCATCPGDCGACPVESWCKLSGTQGQQIKCEINIAAATAASPKATQFQLDINYNASKVTFGGTSCLTNGMDTCSMFGVVASGHSVDTQTQSSGVERLTITKSGNPTVISPAYLQGGQVQGEPYVLDLVFTLKTAISAGQAVQVTLTQMKGADATASPLSAILDGDLIVTSAGGAQPVCGDGQCNGDETCNTCAQDCGSCCGDGQCNYGETCTSCPGDCGACPEESWCKLSGTQGQQVKCEINIAATSSASPKATQFQLDINYNATKVTFGGTSCLTNGMDTCSMFGVVSSGHSVDTQTQSSGVERLTITKSGNPTVISQAYLQGGQVQGNPYVLDLVFTLKTAISAGQAVQVTLTQMKGADATASPLSATQQADGLIVTAQQ